MALVCAALPNPASGQAATANEAEPVELVVYSGRSKSLIGPVLEKYEKASGNTVKVKYGSTAGMTALLLEEGRKTPADVFIAQDAGALGALAKNERVHSVPESILVAVEPRFRSPDGDWVGVTGRARCVAYNTTAMKPADMPASIMDFTDPTWKGRVGWAPGNGSFQAFVTAMRKRVGDEATEAWLRGMIANEAVVYPKNSAIVRALGAGEVDLGFVNHYYLYRFLAEDPKFPVRNHFLPNGDPGALVNVAGACLPVQETQSPQQRAAAEDLIRFLLDQEAQGYFAESTYEYPLAKGVAPARQMISLEVVETPDMDLSDLDDLQGTLVMLRKVGALP
ncbi:MAG: iron ABC transporter substrate-binding protein [Planctomycetes bacterium TMED75]|nr:MAG: iron ABC transporter substrate-binding protein [Planctomycetes bacterium TMED75]